MPRFTTDHINKHTWGAVQAEAVRPVDLESC